MGRKSTRLDHEKMGKVGEKTLLTKVNIPRPITLGGEVLEMTDIYALEEAGLLWICPVAYVVIQQPSGMKKGLIASKSRFSKKQLTIPRVELVAPQIVVNFRRWYSKSLPNYSIREVYGWSYNTVVLQWLQGYGSCK